jgi:hypothetical protein
MAGIQQLNSFIAKFVNLWQSGFDASLEVKAHAGEARILLQVGLGQYPPSSQNKTPKCKVKVKDKFKDNVKDKVEDKVKDKVKENCIANDKI